MSRIQTPLSTLLNHPPAPSSCGAVCVWNGASATAAVRRTSASGAAADVGGEHHLDELAGNCYLRTKKESAWP